MNIDTRIYFLRQKLVTSTADVERHARIRAKIARLHEMRSKQKARMMAEVRECLNRALESAI